MLRRERNVRYFDRNRCELRERQQKQCLQTLHWQTFYCTISSKSE